MAIVLGLDVGTSKLSALALSVETRTPLAVRSAPNDADVPGLPPARHEQDPSRILDRCLGLVRDIIADGAVAEGEIAGICVTGQMHGVMLVDRDLRPATRLVTWRDRRTGKNFDEALSALDSAAPSVTGCRLHPGYGGPTLHWLSSQHGLSGSASLGEGAVALSLADYVTAAFTGVVATEPTHAASWGILDVKKRRWDRGVVKGLGIPEAALPEIRPSAGPLGRLLRDRAAALGLPESVRVCSPVGDNQASVIGAAGFRTDVCVLNLGTGGQVSVPSPELRFVPGIETRPMPFGGYILVGASLCGGWSYSYLRRFYQEVAREMTGREVTDEEAYARLNALAARAPPGAGGLTADTRFGGTRCHVSARCGGLTMRRLGDVTAPVMAYRGHIPSVVPAGGCGGAEPPHKVKTPEIRGGVTGIDTGNLTPANLARAIVEGTVRELAELVRLFGGIHIDRVVASGGAVRKNPLVREVIEQEFDAPCSVGPAREEAALGAAYCAAVGLGLLSPEEVDAAVAAG